MKTNVVNILRLFILILPFIYLPIIIITGAFNIIDNFNNDDVGYVIKGISYSELHALNPINVDSVIDESANVSNVSTLEAEESNKIKEEPSVECTTVEKIEESTPEETDEPEEPKHPMSVESSKPDETYSDTKIEYEPCPDFIYYSKYYDVTYKSDCSIALSREHQSFAYSKCKEYGVPFEVMLGLWGAEASWNINIGVTRDTYYGIGQVHIGYNKDYLKTYGVDLCTPLGGLEGSIIIMRDKLQAHGGDINKALMAYNFGDWGAQKQWDKGVYSTYYTKKILSIANNLKEGN
jgi:hypothetical protein